MSLIGGVVGALTGTSAPGNSGNAPGQVKKQEETEATTEEQVVAEAAEEEAATADSSNGVGTSYAVYAANRAEEEAESSLVRDYDLAAREAAVNATDYARRAAIATQSKLHSEALFEQLEAEAFSPLVEQKSDSASGYGRSDVTRPFEDKADMNA